MWGVQRREESDLAGTVASRLYELELERWVDRDGGVGGKVRAEMGARETKLFGKSHLVAPISLIADLYCIITRT